MQKASGFGPVNLDVAVDLPAGDQIHVILEGFDHPDVGILDNWFGRRRGLDGVRVVNESSNPLRIIGPGDTNPRVPPRTTGRFGVTDGSQPGPNDPAIRAFRVENISTNTVSGDEYAVEVMNGLRVPPEENGDEVSFHPLNLIPGVSVSGRRQ